MQSPSVANRSRSFYHGKKIAYIYKGTTEKRGTKIRVIWGKVTRSHGESTVVNPQLGDPSC